MRGPDGTQLLASGGEDGAVKVWDLVGARQVRCAIPAQTTPYSAVAAFAPMNTPHLWDEPDRLATADIDGSIQIRALD
ncbi:WD40 repeat domain-containing protein, partial [Acinetobacter baumannii]|uniref:WD40 repeat domain-containing protein n=1 Tax=Acinetobacter baumannii TaxID=470 RepID=UPI001BB46D00